MTRPGHNLLKKRSLPGVLLFFAIFCQVSGGPFGLESAVSEAGAWMALLLIVVLPFVWALPDALTTCELAPAIPEEGGYVVWVRRALGPFAGFLNGWWTWLYTLADAAIYPVLFATYVHEAAQAVFGAQVFGGDGAQWGLSVAMIALFGWLNYRGTRVVGFTSVGLALLILIPFAVFAAVGLTASGGSAAGIPFAARPEDVQGSLAAGLGIVMWNYLGWDALSTIAEEVDEPQRAYPRALLAGVAVVTLAYLVPVWIGLHFVPDEGAWVEGAWPAIAEAVGGPWLGNLMRVAAIVSPIALFTGSLLASSRVPFAMAEFGFLPPAFAKLHPRFGTPWVAILFQSLVFAILATKTFQELVALNVIMYGAALILETTALLVLRVKEPDLPRPFRIRGGWPVLGLIFLLPVSLVVILVVLSIQEEGWAAQGLTAAALASGPIVYLLVRNRGSRSGEEA